ncbi:MAG: methyltransferase domain-containing protein [Candidatus Woesearchaeota archaeon]|nr:methyltransferase domain-containing protein [Candidatus Woesearchaeota archaeon]
MKCFIRLLRSNLDLAREEVLALTRADHGGFGDILITDYSMGLEKRLGFSHAIFRFLFTCTKGSLVKEIEGYDWDKVYDSDFCVRAHDTHISEREIAKKIFRRLKDPKVNLRSPKTKIVFFQRDDMIVAGIHMHDVDKSFQSRKAHLRPSLHPTSLHPGLARACINLSGVAKGALVDPFCGSGGLLIEAGLMGYDISGYDIDEGQIARARKNLSHYGISCRLEKQDALELAGRYDVIVTDLPYGKSSKMASDLYDAFFRHGKSLARKMVVVMNKDYSPIGWNIEKRFSVYVHRSMTRKIMVLSQ